MLLTNTLLTIIAALLLVLVLKQNSAPRRPMGNGGGMYNSTLPPQGMGMPPPAAGGGSPMGEFVFQTLKGFPKGCDPKAVLASCDTKEAQNVKAEIKAWADSGLNARELFDKIEATYGKDVLTEEAARIRAMRRGK